MADGEAPLPALRAPKHHKTFAMAFFEAQCEFGPIYADGVNPEKGYRFRSLPAMLDALKPILHAHGLAFSQPPDGVEMHNGRPTFMLRTIILHAKTGEQLVGVYPVCDARLNAHDRAACLTLARRYSIPTIMGVSAESEAQEPAHGSEAASYAEDAPDLIKGEEKDKLVEDWTARMKTATDLDDIDHIMNEVKEKKLSRNTFDGLEHVAMQESERIKAGAVPKPPEPSQFAELDREGRAVLSITDRAVAVTAYTTWQVRAQSKVRLATCTPEERKQLRELKKLVQSYITTPTGQNPVDAMPASTDEGAPV